MDGQTETGRQTETEADTEAEAETEADRGILPDLAHDAKYFFELHALEHNGPTEKDLLSIR